MIKRVYLEITDVCNLDCPFCTNEKGQSFMKLDDIKNSIDQIKEYTDYLYLHVLGEPLLHPDFEEIFKYCDKKEMNVQLVTNGTLLDSYPNILSYKSLRKLSISLHSISDSKVSNSYFDTINKLIDINNDKFIELRFYDLEHLSNDLHSYLNELKAKYSFSVTEKVNSYKIKDNVYLYFNNLFDWPNINDEYVSDRGKCRGAIDQLAILHNLDVTICCLDPKGHNKIGNLKESSLKQIIDSNIYKTCIDNIRNNKLTFELCKKCKYHLRFK